jgi:hypothetical protein
MPSTPISPPGGGAGTPSQQPGGAYVASGMCSGTAFSHTQTIYVSYQVSAEATLIPKWLPEAGPEINGLGCFVQLSYTDTLDQFSTSANDLSSCANAANTREMHVLDFSALQHTGDGLGLSGYVSTSSNGFTRRWTQAGDTEDQYYLSLPNAWFPLDQIVAKAVIRSMVERIAAGGIQWAAMAHNTPSISPSIPKFNTNLVYI